MNGQTNFNSVSSQMETHSLMDTTEQHYKGRLGTPDANNASYMSSDFKNQQQEQHLTSQAAAFETNTQDLFKQLLEVLALEAKYQPSLFLPLQSNVSILSASLISAVVRYTFKAKGGWQTKTFSLSNQIIFHTLTGW